MGILDSLFPGSQGGYGGLLEALMHPSPLMKTQEVQQPLYDAMGTPFAGAAQPDVPSPFPALPQANYAAFAPKPGTALYSPFNQGAAPISGVPSMQPQAPQPAQAVAPPPDPSPSINIGGYQMPQVGTMADYTPVGSSSTTDISAQSRQPQQQQAPEPLPPAFGGSGYIDRINNGGSLIGSLFGDTTQQKNLTAQYQALVPLVGHQKAMLAVMNPEAGKTILAQALEKKQYGFIKTDGDQIVATDPTKGTAAVAFGGNDANKAGIAGPDGKIIPYPEGLDAAGRKTFANHIATINADVAGGKMTEVQAKSAKFGTQMELAQRNIKGLESEGKSIFGKVASGVPLGNLVQSSEYQKYTQAKNSFLTAVLRDESGAAIGSQEFVRREKEMFPQPGDDDATMQQKAQLRQVAIDGMKKTAGPGYKSPAESAAGPSRADIETEMRRRGLLK